MLRQHSRHSRKQQQEKQQQQQQEISKQKLSKRILRSANRAAAAVKPAKVLAASTIYCDLDRPKSICTKSFRLALLAAVGYSDALNNNKSFRTYNSPQIGLIKCEHCGYLGLERTACSSCCGYLMPEATKAASATARNSSIMISAKTTKRKSAKTAAAGAAAGATAASAASAGASASAPANAAAAAGRLAHQNPSQQNTKKLTPATTTPFTLSANSAAKPMPDCIRAGAALSADIQRFLATRGSVLAAPAAARQHPPAALSSSQTPLTAASNASQQHRLPNTGTASLVRHQQAVPTAASSATVSSAAVSATSLISFVKRPRLEPHAASTSSAPTPRASPAVVLSAPSSASVRPLVATQSLLGSPVVEMPLDQVCIGGSAFQKVDPPHNLLKVYRGFTQFSFPRSVGCGGAGAARGNRKRRRQRRRGDDDFDDDHDAEDEDYLGDTDDEEVDSDDSDEEEEVDYAQIHLHHNQLSKVAFGSEPTCFVGFRLRSADFSRRICCEAGLEPDALSAAESRDLGKKWIVLVSDNERDDELKRLFQFYSEKKTESNAKFDFDLQFLNKVSARGMLDSCQEGFFNELVGQLAPAMPSQPVLASSRQTASSASISGAVLSSATTAKRFHCANSNAITTISSSNSANSSSSSAAKSAEIYQKVVNSNLAIELIVQQQQQQAVSGNGAPHLADASSLDIAPFQNDSSQEQQRQLSVTASVPDGGVIGSSNSKPPPRLTGQVIEKFSYSPGGSNGITITNADLMCLNPCEYLNDVAIDFYLKYMYHEILTPEQRKATHIFNCFFFKRLSQKLDPPPAADESAASLAIRRHDTVAKWTRKVDIFSKDFILIPINENCHWFLAVICFPWMVGSVSYSGSAEASVSEKLPFDFRITHDGTLRMPCVLMFDSLLGSTRSPNVLAIREYLQVEWNIKKKTLKGPKVFDKETIRGYCPSVPQQPNTVDCGPYVLHYAELFFRRPVREFTFSYFQSEMLNWFRHEEINYKRADIQDLIVSLAGKNGALGPDAPAAVALARKASDSSAAALASPNTTASNNSSNSAS